MRLVPEWAHNQALAALTHEGPLARMAREIEDEFDRQAVAAVSGPLDDLGKAWPGPELGAVSGDAIAGAKAARMFGTPDFNLWERPGVRAQDPAQRLHPITPELRSSGWSNIPGECR